MCRCAAITTLGSVVRRAALWQSEDKNGKNMADAVRPGARTPWMISGAR
jgi:hypothetical protein